jgi:hypothetical protein
MSEAIQRLLRDWKRGEKCIAVMDIFYEVYGDEVKVPEGSIGYVQQITSSGELHIAWVGFSYLATPEFRFETSPELVDPA